MIRSELDLVDLALALGARDLGALSEPERAMVRRAARLRLTGRPRAGHRRPAHLDPELVAATRLAIVRGHDPLGSAFCSLRSRAQRRLAGATYTPPALVAAMTAWAAARRPGRIVDPGAGSGRFIVAAGRAARDADLVAVELDPLAALICRAHLATAGLAPRAHVECVDYRRFDLPAARRGPNGAPAPGPTVFLGNPPYSRHHVIDSRGKAWLTETARSFGLRASRLAGLHAHFFLATARLARPGDFGAFVTAAEWLDVNYGALVRTLLLGPLGGESLHLVEPTVQPFEDAATTAVVTCFAVGARPPTIRLRRVSALERLAPLDGAGARPRMVPRERLELAARWTPLTRPGRAAPAGHVELGELCRVHRGQVTGCNEVWIAGAHSAELPLAVLYACVTKAHDLFGAAGGALRDAAPLRRVIDLPVDLELFLDRLAPDHRRAVERFLRRARAHGAHRGFIARHRRAWWSVGLREPAPILATYMARRPPAFVRNHAGARHINVAHGIYPRQPLPGSWLDRLARHLARATSLRDGRTYAGGLTKFEPGEMERLLVPGPDLLATATS